MILQDKYTLNNKVQIPKIGFGTWMISDADSTQAVIDAINIGYRHIDTAQSYGNERGVGEGIRQSGVAREDLFVTTKLAAEIKSYDEAVAAIDESIAKMGLDYIDMMIIHSPKPWAHFHGSNHYFAGNLDAWRALEDAYAAGKLKAIGVSNFEKVDLENIIKNSNVKPAVNQVLAHISNTPFELIDFTESQGVLVEAYSPIAHGAILGNKTVMSIAEKYSVSPAQLSIRYILQLGLLPLPKTVNPAHMKNNADVDFEISEADMETLKSVPKIKDYGEDRDMPVFGGGK